MNDSRYHQPLLLASTIKSQEGSAATPVTRCIHSLARPARHLQDTITTPPPPPPPPAPPLPLRRPPQHHRRERESVRAHVRATADCHSPTHPSIHPSTLTPRLAHLRLLARAYLLALQRLKESSAIGRAAALSPSQHPHPLPANQPADRE